MTFRKQHFFFILLISLSLEFIICAPTTNEETEAVATIICEIEDLLNCVADDHECAILNEKRKQNNQAVCDENPQCPYCNASIPVMDGNLIVFPEIVPTLSPVTEDIPVNETIIIDGDPSTVTQSQPLIRNERERGKLIERNIVIENDNETQYYRGYVDPSSNITTIIRLTNLINNTNIVNMPTTLNNTNVNNIHVYSNRSSSSGGKFGLGYTEEGPCCWSMKPGGCKQTTAGPKCRHKKEKVCGRQCNKKMIHYGRSMCNSIPQWPYVMCPQAQNPPYMPYPYYPPAYNPSYPPFDDENEDEDDFPIFPEDEELEREESGWIVMQEKCKIVSEDGLQITNCTDKNVEFENPFARNSVDDSPRRTARHTAKHLQTHKQQQQQQQVPYMQPYGYPMMQPIYFQPIPVFIPQYFAPPSPAMMNNNYPQQLPFPPLNSDQYYEEPVIQSKEHNPYRKSRKHAKKHPIIVEHDEEL